MAEDGTRDAVAPGAAQLPAVRGFVLEAQLGRGAVGVTYRARRENSTEGPLLALKLLHPQLAAHPATGARIAKLSTGLAAADHAHLARFGGFGQLPGTKVRFYFAEYVDGLPITYVLTRDGTTVRQVVDRFAELLSGLAEAHRHGVLHLGLRPGNVLLEQAPPRVRLCDVGLNRLVKRDAQEERVVHAPEQLRYTSPEQLCAGELDGRSDIFAVGVLLYEALTGVSPFARESEADTIEAICNSEPELPSRARPERRVPRELEAICMRALRTRPDDRFRSPLEMSQALRAALELLGARADAALGPSFASVPVQPTTLRVTLPGDQLSTKAKLFLGVALLAAAGSVLYVVTSGKRAVPPAGTTITR